MTETRSAAQYCPYCGGTDLHPHESSHAAWGCRSCRRVFSVRMLGLLPPPPRTGTDPHPRPVEEPA